MHNVRLINALLNCSMLFCYLQLTDFGEAIIVENDLSFTTERGTPNYCAPERFKVASEDTTFSTASDIYSLGTFYLVCIPP